MALAKAQTDSAMFIPLLGVHFGGQLPFGDLSQRFGPSLNAGGSFMLKTKKNWIFGADYNYFFGRNVKEDVLSQLKNSDGFMIDNEGYPADVRVTERGMGIHLFAGRVFRLSKNNPNSGLMINIGLGYLQHKIKLYDAQQKIAAIKGNLAHGFDRLTSGLSTTQFIGYLHLSENRLTNFYAGVEFNEAITKSARKLNYDTGLADTKQRLDILMGLRIGWILPLYKKMPNNFYYD
jgi:hypothetical protein